MELTREPAYPPWREIPALDLDALVQRHAAGFGRVRACGDWSDRCFRRVAGPLLLAFARHAHLLPVDIDDPDGSLLDAGLEACSDAVLESAVAVAVAPVKAMPAGRPASPGRRVHRSAGQDAVVLHALSAWVVAAVTRWQVLDQDGRALELAARPLSDQLEAAAAAAPRARTPPTMLRYRIQRGDAHPVGVDHGPGAPVLGMMLLLRALPASALSAACASSPPLLHAALGLARPGDAGMHRSGAQSGPDPMPGRPEATPLPGRHVLRDAMRALIADGRWTVNVRRSRLWFLHGRLYLVWKTAADELSQRLAVDRTSLLPALVRHGMVVAVPAEEAGVQAEAAGPMLAIRTPYTEALAVVELTDASGWLRWVPSPDDPRPDDPRPDDSRHRA